ncbi:MAG: H+transporting two-sector ATPase C subunit [Deltaproteobacteria bacterium]|nr:H+transporting two-sector ATPase C subunit [Deltaproteobacteria bacterium]
MDTNRSLEERLRCRPHFLRRVDWGLAIAVLFTATAGVVTALPAIAAGDGNVDLVRIWGFAAAALSTAVGALGAAYAVGHVGAAALGAIGERPEIAGRALIFVGLAEGIAIYGLIVSIMILGRL